MSDLTLLVKEWKGKLKIKFFFQKRFSCLLETEIGMYERVEA